MEPLNRDFKIVNTETDKAEAPRVALARALSHPDARTAFDIFRSEFPDEAFEGVFDQPRHQDWSQWPSST
jgi:hypothetical protein